MPVTFGVLFTFRELGPVNHFSAVLALLSGTLVYAALRRRKTLRSRQLTLDGLFYLTFLAGAVAAVF